MTDCLKILSIIETVDPSDAHAMFRLNELVYEWLLTVNPSTPYGKFVYSRDALKQIRPDKLIYSSFQQPRNSKQKQWTVTLLARHQGLDKDFNGCASTEELAELHAIIQAISYDRGQK